jgi:hypothetical protein
MTVCAYDILGDVRLDIGEHSEDLVRGVDRSGGFKNEWLMQRINDSQRYLFNLLLKRVPELFLKTSSLTTDSSELTLPGDFGIGRRLETSDGHKVSPVGPAYRPVSKFLYYRSGKRYVITGTSNGDTYKLYYYSKPRDIHSGWVTTFDSNNLYLTLESPLARAVADYYNDMDIVNRYGDHEGEVDTISAYTAARVATVASDRWESGAFYGLVSELPEVFHHLIAPGASLLAKRRLPQGMSSVSPGQERADYQDMVVEALKAFAGNKQDAPVEEMWVDYNFAARTAAQTRIPGHE